MDKNLSAEFVYFVNKIHIRVLRTHFGGFYFNETYWVAVICFLVSVFNVANLNVCVYLHSILNGQHFPSTETTWVRLPFFFSLYSSKMGSKMFSSSLMKNSLIAPTA